MNGYEGGVVLAHVERSGFVESWHHGSVVVLSATGEVLASAGDVAGPVFGRSANKPLQTIGMMRSGLQVPPDLLALISASHHGEDQHLSGVRALLASADLPESALRCPPAWRLSHMAGDKTAVFMNCSGKHAGMLATCVTNGWSTHDYYEPSHPLQQRLLATFEEYADEPAAAIGVDGCGAPAAAISLTGLATGFLRAAKHEVADAMRAHPEMASGTGADDALLMRAVPGLFCKVGAEAVWAAGIAGVGAVALKIDDGGSRARGPIMVSALRRLGVDVDIPQLASPSVLGRGERVGSIRSVW